MSCHFTYYVRNSCKILFAPFCCILSVVYLLSWVWLCNPMDYNQLGSLSMEFLRQEYWSGLPFPSPEDLPNPGTELTSLVSPALAGGFFISEPPGKPNPLWYCSTLFLLFFNHWVVSDYLHHTFTSKCITNLKISCSYFSFMYIMTWKI